MQSKKNIHIAIFSGEIPSTTFIEHLINGVAKTYRVSLFGVNKAKLKDNTKNITIYKTPKSHFNNFFISLLRTLKLLLKRPHDLWQLLKELKKYSRFYDRWIWYTKFLPIVLYKPDVFHMQWARDLEFYLFLKTTFNVPLIISLSGAHINYTPIIEKHIAQLYTDSFFKVDRFHAVSKAIALEASKYGEILSRTQVIHSPIPEYFFKAFKPYKKNEKKCIKLISVGRLHWKKGYRYALDSIALLKSKGFNVHYTIIGSSIPIESIAFQLEQLKIKDQVSFIGQLSQKEIISILQTQNILLLPSVEEGIANVVLEAMAVGLPVISSNCGGMSEVVKPKETGWLVPVRDSQAIAEAILDVTQTSEQELQRIMQNAHDFVKAEFNAADSIEQFIKLYDSVLSN